MTAEQAPIVFVIDDDRDVRESLQGLFRSVGLAVALFESPEAFLASDAGVAPGCLVLDVRLPGKNGIDFYEDIAGTPLHHPAVFISGHADVPMSVRAMKAGAVEFLTKPVREQDLLDAVQLAIASDDQQRRLLRDTDGIRVALSSLTARERAILDQVALGRRNKQIAAELGVSEATVKSHRGSLMHKMNAQSLAELIRMVK